MTGLISVADALSRLFGLVPPPQPEVVPLTAATGRVLLQPVIAMRDQPPFDASAMDGYALATAPIPGAILPVVGTSAAGQGYRGSFRPGEAIRIFTGAPLPAGATFVVMQENVTRVGDTITLGAGAGNGPNIRPSGGDFAVGATLKAPRRLTPADIALIAAMGVPRVTVARRPVVAILATGDELVAPGDIARDDQIYSSNGYGLHALVTQMGGQPRLLPIAADTLASLDFAFGLADGADIILTIGGVSVGDHDLVAKAALARGADMAFRRIAMRPGKPLMAGRMGPQLLIGLPGNPVSAMVCGQVFLGPVIAAMQGLPAQACLTEAVPLAKPLPANGPREHYLRAQRGPDGVTPLDRQDSSLLTILADADCLIVQPPDDPGRATGESVNVINLRLYG